MKRVEKTDIDEQTAASIRNFSWHAKGDAARDKVPAMELTDFIQKKAALISAHFLLPAGSKIVDMGCGTGEVTYALAQLNPRQAFIGIDRDKEAIEMARRLFRLPNLTFMHSEIAQLDIEDETIDGMINSNVLHHVYSWAGFDTTEVSSLLERQVRKLKTGGIMLVRDYMLPSVNDYVLLELPDRKSEGVGYAHMSDVDLLISFSQTARPMISGCEGFFINELPPRRPDTRLFRLPHKWAVEFIHRKESRDRWEKELRKEYTFFSYNDFRREFASLGMRMVYSAPYWNPWVMRNSFKGKFQMYREDGTVLSPPPTNYFIVAQKVAGQRSLGLAERRPSQKPAENLKIMVVRDEKSGAVHELVKRPGDYCDIIPYRVTPDNRLLMYVRSGYPRPIVNAVSRGSANLDGKRWSGHLIEPISMNAEEMTLEVEENRRQIFDYVRNYAQLRTKPDENWHVGDTYFPQPERIDEAVEPVFIEVENPNKVSWPIDAALEKDLGFIEPGTIVEIDAADIIAAAQVGLLPDPRLELYAMDLMMQLDMNFPGWVGDSMPEIPTQKLKVYEPEDVLKEVKPGKFVEDKTAPKTLKAERSLFVEEGKVGRASRAIAAQDVEFIVPDDGIDNIALVMPLSRGWDNTLLVALDPATMPVPNRMGGEGAMLTVPSFPLPKEVRNVDDAKAFVAQKFGISTEYVATLGESYFTHTGVTPQRVYPFIITAPGKAQNWSPRYMRIKRLWRLTSVARVFFNTSVLRLMARTHMMMGADHDMSQRRTLENFKYKGFNPNREKEILDDKGTGATRFPSRVLGQRGSAAKVAPKILDMAAPRADLDAGLPKKPVASVVPVTNAAELATRIGKRLVDSYAQTKKVPRKPQKPDFSPIDPKKR